MTLTLGERHPVRAHAAFITVFVLSAAITALILTYSYAERFAGEVTTFFQPAETTQLTEHATRALGAPVPTTPFKVIGQTLDGLIKSDALLRDTVMELHLDVVRPTDFSGPWYIVAYRYAKDWAEEYGGLAWSYLRFGREIPDDPVDTAIRDIRKNTKIISEDSYVFLLRTLAKSPEAGSAIANKLAAKLIVTLNREDHSSALRRGEQVTELRAQKVGDVAAIETSMHNLLASAGVASIDADIEQTTSRYSQLSLQNSDATSSLRQEEARLTGYSARLQGRPATAVAMDNPGGQQPARLGPDDFARLNYERLNMLRARQTSLQHDIDEVRQRLEQLNRVHAEYDLLSAQLQAAKRDLSGLTDAAQENVIRASYGQTELRVESPAQIPLVPVSPIKIYHVGLAFGLSLVFAIGLSIMMGYFNVRLFMIGEKWRLQAGSTNQVARFDAS